MTNSFKLETLITQKDYWARYIVYARIFPLYFCNKLSNNEHGR